MYGIFKVMMLAFCVLNLNSLFKKLHWCTQNANCHLLSVSYNNPRPRKQAKNQIKHIYCIGGQNYLK